MSARRWAVYLRISKDDEANGEGVERQEKLCRRLLVDRGLDGSIVDVYVDNDVSAFRNVRRPEYERLVDDIKNGLVSGILAYKSDRIYRRMTDLEDLIRLVGEEDPPRVAIESVRSGRIDFSSASGRMTARILGAVAQAESETMSERLRDKMADNAAKGRPSGGRRPYGYEDDRVTPRESEAAVVREIVERVAAGETLTGIAVSLNRREPRVPSATGKTWTLVTVRQVALNPRYIGARVHRGKIAKLDAWPALVDVLTFNRATEILRDPERIGRRHARRNLLAGGVIRCGLCGTAMIGRLSYGRNGTSAMDYRCPQPSAVEGACGGVTMRAAAVEALVEEYLFRVVEGPEYGEALARRAGVDEDVAALVSSIETELRELDDLFDEGAIPKERYKASRLRKVERLDAARIRMSADTSKAATVPYAGKPGALRSDWSSLSLDRKQAIVRAAIDRVTIRPSTKRGRQAPDPSRVEVAPAV